MTPAKPSPRATHVLTQIAPVAWEHPADRAALNTLRAIPGFDEVVRKIMGAIGERGVRHLFTANAVRVGPRQRPKLDRLYGEVLATMDWSERPELFVSQTPFANAMAVGFDKPFIVLNSGALALLDEDERRVLLGHELGHVMSGHATYTTIALLILRAGFTALPGLGLIALPVQLALLEWYRKAELSSDRAGLIATQDPIASMRLFLRLAGGASSDDEMSLDEFLVQAKEYETGGNVVDTVLKALNVAFSTHPFATVRAAELQRWVESGAYDRIIGGEYPRRGAANARPLSEDYADAAAHYREETRTAVDQVADALKSVGDLFTGAFRGAGGPGAPGAPGGGPAAK
ncbi:MAG TPA: M48 family metallopeptidase [Gemmatimonadaceae bacterium]|nr:M48 family metallopeptidase [Gemmatimonadaceae bacterium]